MIFTAIPIDAKSPTHQIEQMINTLIQLYRAHYEAGGRYLNLTGKQYQQTLESWHRICQEHAELPEITIASRGIVLNMKDSSSLDSFVKIVARLKSPAYWRELQTIAGDTEKLKSCKNNWDLQARYAHYTLNALFEADQLLQDMLELHDSARSALGRQHQTQQISLQKLKKEINQERACLAEAFYYRIKMAFHYHTLKDRQPLFYVNEQINALIPASKMSYGFLQNKEIQRSDGLFPIEKAYAYIKKHGSHDLNRALQLRDFFKLEGPHAAFPILSIQQDKQCFLVPADMARFIPKKRSFWSRFIPGFNDRYQFMQDKTALLFRLMDFRKDSERPFSQKSINRSYWQQLLDLQQDLDAEFNACALKERTWFSFLYSKNNQLISTWKSYVTTQQKKIIKKQMEILSGLNIEQFLGGDFPDQNKFEKRAKRFQAQLNQLEKEIDRSFHQADRLKYKSQIRGVYSKLNVYLPDESSNDLSSMLYHLANENKPLGEESYQSLIAELKERSDDPLSTNMKDAMKLMVDRMIENISELTVKFANNRSIHEMTSYLNQATKVFKQLLPLMDDGQQYLQSLKQSLFTSFSPYPNYVKGLDQSIIKKRRQDFSLLQLTLFNLVSLDPQLMSEEKELYSRVEHHLDELKAGRAGRSMSMILARSLVLRQAANHYNESDSENEEMLSFGVIQ